MQASWMILASLFFATMGVFVKLGSQFFTTAELVFWRGLLGMFFMAGLCRWQRVDLRSPVPLMHLWRSVIGVASLSAWFYAIGELPLATAMTLNYMSGIWVAVILIGGTLAMGRIQDAARQGPMVLTVMASFAGVIMVLRPTIEQNQLFAGLIGLLSGLMASLAYLQVSALGRVGEPESRTVFYFSVGTTLIGGLATWVQGPTPWDWDKAIWLLPIGLLAALGQLCMTLAYNRGATLVVANLQYSGIVFAALYGLVLFGDAIAWMGWIGMVVIVLSGVLATALRQRTLPSAPADDH
ncbi:MAG: DMT family transporter [Limnohabitans sp.]